MSFKKYPKKGEFGAAHITLTAADEVGVYIKRGTAIDNGVGVRIFRGVVLEGGKEPCVFLENNIIVVDDEREIEEGIRALEHKAKERLESGIWALETEIQNLTITFNENKEKLKKLEHEGLQVFRDM